MISLVTRSLHSSLFSQNTVNSTYMFSFIEPFWDCSAFSFPIMPQSTQHWLFMNDVVQLL